MKCKCIYKKENVKHKQVKIYFHYVCILPSVLLHIVYVYSVNLCTYVSMFCMSVDSNILKYII